MFTGRRVRAVACLRRACPEYWLLDSEGATRYRYQRARQLSSYGGDAGKEPGLGAGVISIGGCCRQVTGRGEGCSATNGATCGVLDRGYKALASRQGWALTLTLRRPSVGYYWVIFPRLSASGLARWVGVDAGTPGTSVTILSRRGTHDGLQKAHASESVKRPIRAPVWAQGACGMVPKQ